ncbi:MAG: hypothetical protein ACTHNU_09150 [Gaiellales bacterium]
MRFRSPNPIDEPVAEEPDEELQRVREWQRERLSHLGYRPGIAAMLVADAWTSGEHCDLVHQIEDLISKGATLEQAARIVVPAVELDPLFAA